MGTTEMKLGKGVRRFPAAGWGYVAGASSVLLVIPVAALVWAALVEPWTETVESQHRAEALWFALALQLLATFFAVRLFGAARLRGFGKKIYPDAIARGVSSKDDASRERASAQLFLVPEPCALTLASASLRDPIRAVRFHAIRAFAESDDGVTALADFLARGKASDASTRSRVLEDIPEVFGAGSPFRTKRRRPATLERRVGPLSHKSDYYHLHVLWIALEMRPSSKDALPIVVAAQRCGVPLSFHWGTRDHEKVPDFPNLCCLCGAARPARRLSRETAEFFSALTSDGSDYVPNEAAVYGAAEFPVCTGCSTKEPGSYDEPGLRVDAAGGLTVSFTNPKFVAAMVAHPEWSLRKHPYRRGSADG